LEKNRYNAPLSTIKPPRPETDRWSYDTAKAESYTDLCDPNDHHYVCHEAENAGQDQSNEQNFSSCKENNGTYIERQFLLSSSFESLMHSLKEEKR
jgi:hypothetical protein